MMNLPRIKRIAERQLSLESFIRRPDRLIWPEDLNDIKELFNDIVNELPGKDKKRTFISFILSAAILSGRNNALLQVLNNLFDPYEIGVNLAWDQIVKAKWIGVPLALADDADGVIVYAFLGMGLDMQENFAADSLPCMDQASRDAVVHAAKLASAGKGVFFWIPSLYETKVTGTSLGLPVYVGLKLYNRISEWPKIVCTGSLTDTGNLEDVYFLDNKIQAARIHGFSGFVYPDNGQIRSPGFDGIELMPVSDPETAVALTGSYCPGMGHQHLYFLQQQESFSDCAGAVCGIDLSLLKYLEQKECYFSGKALEELKQNDELRDRLINRLQESIIEKQPDYQRIAFLLKTLFPFDYVMDFIDQNPKKAFEAARLHIQIDNHRGILQEIGQWHDLARKCTEQLIAEGNIDEKELLVSIYAMVGKLQNGYMFKPDKAENIITPYISIIARLQQDLDARKKYYPYAASETLAKYYGTMAQHYGFCGSRYINKTLEYCDLAQSAFGDGLYPAMGNDWKRIFSYRFFALLDAGKQKDALAALEEYLGTSLSALNYDSMDFFDHFHLSRYLSETGKKANDYEKWCTDLLVNNDAGIKSQHPFQLWTLNMGKILGDNENKKKCWKRSIAICNAGGPTMRMMGLMPLSLLYKFDLEQVAYLERECQAILSACENSGLWQTHFEPLWTSKWEDVLDCVYGNPPRYFPFSYR